MMYNMEINKNKKIKKKNKKVVDIYNKIWYIK